MARGLAVARPLSQTTMADVHCFSAGSGKRRDRPIAVACEGRRWRAARGGIRGDRCAAVCL